MSYSGFYKSQLIFNYHLHFLVVLVLLVVEVFEVEEVGLLGSLDCPQAVHDGDGVHRHSIGSISVKESSGCSTAVELGPHGQEVMDSNPTGCFLVSLSVLSHFHSISSPSFLSPTSVAPHHQTWWLIFFSANFDLLFKPTNFLINEPRHHIFINLPLLYSKMQSKKISSCRSLRYY